MLFNPFNHFIHNGKILPSTIWNFWKLELIFVNTLIAESNLTGLISHGSSHGIFLGDNKTKLSSFIFGWTAWLFIYLMSDKQVLINRTESSLFILPDFPLTYFLKEIEKLDKYPKYFKQTEKHVAKPMV